MRFTVGSDLNYRIADRAAKPLLFEPEINWATFAQPNIIQEY